MPRKTKEQKELENENKGKKVAKKQPQKKASSTSKVATTKKASTTSSKNTATNNPSATKNKTTTSKKTSTTAKKKSSTVTKKATTKNKTTTAKKSTTKKNASPKKKVDIVEYYDLPYRYNQTIVKVLAQTPTNLFIYWDISDQDRKNFEKQYGDNFFETTKPILIIYNDTLGYHFEI